LYGKQSYTGGTVCSYPFTYIEPYPEFYQRLKLFSDNAANFFQEVLNGFDFQSKSDIIGYYTRYAEIMGLFRNIAEKELSATPLNDEEITFLKTMISEFMASGPSITGWFNDLFFEEFRMLKLPPLDFLSFEKTGIFIFRTSVIAAVSFSGSLISESFSIGSSNLQHMFMQPNSYPCACSKRSTDFISQDVIWLPLNVRLANGDRGLLFLDLQNIFEVQDFPISRDADLYILDEPSAYLDVEERLAMARVIRRVVESRGVVAFVVEHDVAAQDFIADRIMVFEGEAA
jgi:hypothetical protein